MFDRVVLLCVILMVMDHGSVLASVNRRFINNDQTCTDTVHLTNNVTHLAHKKSLDLSWHCIVSVGENPFPYFFSLTSLNLSFNVINSISYAAFTSLVELKQLDLSHNHLSELQFETYNLRKLNMLNASHNQIEIIEATVFKNFASLEYLDLSNNAIQKIEVDAFTKIELLVNIDLSNNRIKTLNVDLSKFLYLKHIFLNNNKITLQSGKEFANILNLETLSLENNDILVLYPDSFLNSDSIEILRLSSNRRLKIIGSPFKSPSLKELAIDNINSAFTFNTRLASLVSVEAHHIALNNLSDVHLYNIPFVGYLNLSFNEVSIIDRYSFPSLTCLEILDLSFNRIVHIQPGSFKDTRRLKTLKLEGNRLKRLQFGAFHGIKKLTELDLSYNEIYTIDAKLLPTVARVLLHNNKLTILNIDEFFTIHDDMLKTLSIDGNLISCETLFNFKNGPHGEHLKDLLTTSEADYYTENFEGIPCQSDESNAVYVKEQ